MNCRWIASGIAVIVSIPLAPFLIRNVERLVGANDPVVVTSPAWKVETAKTESAESNSLPWQNSNGHVSIIVDISQSMRSELDKSAGGARRAAQLRDQIAAVIGPGGQLDPAQKMHIVAHSMGGLNSRNLLSINSDFALRIRNAYQGGDLSLPAGWARTRMPLLFVYSDADSAFNHGIASGRFDSYSGWGNMLTATFPSAHRTGFAATPDGFVLVGGGAMVRWDAVADNFYTWAIPSGDFWAGSQTFDARDHTAETIFVDSANINYLAQFVGSSAASSINPTSQNFAAAGTSSAGLAINDASGSPGNSVTVPILLASSGVAVSAMQFTYAYDPKMVTYVSPRAGDHVSTAAKSLTVTGSFSQFRLVGAGLNQNRISDGTAANFTFNLNSTLDWVTVSPSARTGNGSVTVTLAANTAAPTRLKPNHWTLAADPYLLLAQASPGYSAQLDSATMDLNKSNTVPAIKRSTGNKSASTASRSKQSQRVGSSGWYSLDLGESQEAGTRIDLEFDSTDGESKQYTLTSSGVQFSKRVAWIYVNRPGLVTVTSASGGQPTLHSVGFAELVRKSREISFAKAELTVFLLCEVAPVGVWILLVCLLRWLAYRAIQTLPRPVRHHAGHEIEVFLAVAKWAGVGCYGIWTFKDILTGAGIVLLR